MNTDKTRIRFAFHLCLSVFICGSKTMASLLIQNGTILDPSQKLQRKGDLLVRNGRVAAIGTNLGKKACRANSPL